MTQEISLAAYTVLQACPWDRAILQGGLAGLWRALVFGDAEGIKQHAAAMNAADSYAFFASMLTMRPWEEITK